MHVQAFVPGTSVEALDKGVLYWFAGADEIERDPGSSAQLSPGRDIPAMKTASGQDAKSLTVWRTCLSRDRSAISGLSLRLSLEPSRLPVADPIPARLFSRASLLDARCKGPECRLLLTCPLAFENPIERVSVLLDAEPVTCTSRCRRSPHHSQSRSHHSERGWLEY